MAQLPVFVINLDRRPDRWEAISADLERMGLKAERVPAVDARTVTDEELGERIDLETQLVRMGRGSQATILSHMRAFERLLDGTSPAALFLQDDAELASDLPVFLESLDWWPDGAGVVQLEAHHRVRSRYFSSECAPRHRGRQFRRISVWGPSAAGFMVRRHAARTILARCTGVQMSIDHLLFNLRISRLARELQPVQVLPGLVRQREVDTSSDIRPWKNETRIPVRARLRRHCMSVPRKALVFGAWLAGYVARGFRSNSPTM